MWRQRWAERKRHRSSIFSFGYDALHLLFSVLKMITASGHSYIFLFSPVHFGGRLCVCAVDQRVCQPPTTNGMCSTFSALEIVWPKIESHNEYMYAAMTFIRSSWWRWLDLPCVPNSQHSTATTVAIVVAANSTAFIYGKSPLNATQNEFNNGSNIKMVICYMTVRRLGAIGCVCVCCKCSSLAHLHRITFCSIRFQVNWFAANRSVHTLNQWGIGVLDCTCDAHCVRVECVFWRKAIRDNDNVEVAVRYCLRFRYYCIKKNLNRPNETFAVLRMPAKIKKTNRFWTGASYSALSSGISLHTDRFGHDNL